MNVFLVYGVVGEHHQLLGRHSTLRRAVQHAQQAALQKGVQGQLRYEQCVVHRQVPAAAERSGAFWRGAMASRTGLP